MRQAFAPGMEVFTGSFFRTCPSFPSGFNLEAAS